MKKEKSMDLLALSSEEQVLRHNLETREFWSKQDLPFEGTDDPNNTNRKTVPPIPSKWAMLQGITLYPWQEDCVNRWFTKKNGTIKVVTGAGKTILALAIIEKLQAVDSDLRVAIVVPTLVLQDQWYKEILRMSNLPPHAIGKLGGGQKGSFGDGVRILICVLKSASMYLARLVETSNASPHLLLVADECHKAGAPDMSKVFQTKRAYNLGLSATPEREVLDDNLSLAEDSYNSSLLGKELGPIIYELTVHQALEQGILPEFEVHHIGLPLMPSELQEYEQLTRRLSAVSDKLREVGHRHGFHDSSITYRASSLSERKDELGLLATEYLFLTSRRKHLLYNAQSRMNAVSDILLREFQHDKDVRAILFHESIESVMLLYYQLLQKGLPVVVEHSKLPGELRETSIELFRQGVAQIIVSAKSLIEGFNVPETDIGIVVASSTSVRQRIQTIGRLLRKREAVDKIARIYVLYMQGTVDELIYGKEDWDSLLGPLRNRYFLVNDDGEYVEVDGAPRSPLPRDGDIDLHELEVGSEYPGAYEGVEFTCDSDGNVFTSNRELVINPQGIPAIIRRVKGGFGRFKVTPAKRYILTLVPQGEEWVVMFCGQLPEPFRVAGLGRRQSETQETEVGELQIGDEFPRELVGTDLETISIKQRGGRQVIAKKEGKGERFAKVGVHAKDLRKGKDAERLLAATNDFRLLYPGLSKFLLTKSRHVVVLIEGAYRYVCTLEEGLDFS